ncbi:MAG: VOC family protein, partial [Cyclobacteriaceae bacterium]
YVYFECEDLDERVEVLRQKGIIFDELPEDKRWLWREARLRDPDGNRIILFYGGINRKNPPWRV